MIGLRSPSWVTACSRSKLSATLPHLIHQSKNAPPLLVFFPRRLALATCVPGHCNLTGDCLTNEHVESKSPLLLANGLLDYWTRLAIIHWRCRFVPPTYNSIPSISINPIFRRKSRRQRKTSTTLIALDRASHLLCDNGFIWENRVKIINVKYAMKRMRLADISDLGASHYR